MRHGDNFFHNKIISDQRRILIKSAWNWAVICVGHAGPGWSGHRECQAGDEAASAVTRGRPELRAPVSSQRVTLDTWAEPEPVSPDPIKQRERVKRGDIGIQIDWGNNYTGLEKSIWKTIFLRLIWQNIYKTFNDAGDIRGELHQEVQQKIKWQGFVNNCRRQMSWGLMSSSSSLFWCL